MKKVWFGLGAIVIAILLLLATRFVQFKEVLDDGNAVMDNGVSSMLMRAADDGGIAMELPMYKFNALDVIFKRGNSYYMGANQKQRIDLDYPLYIDEGVGLEIVKPEGMLFNEDYERVEVYEGLVVNNGISYNPGGERADACSFVFFEVGNGTYINCKEMSFVERDNEREVPLNSIIYFSRDHLAYYVYNQGVLEYRCASFIGDDTLFIVDDKEISYYDLLLKLGVIYEPVKKDKNKDFGKNENPDEITEETEPVEELTTPVPEKPERVKPDRQPSTPSGDRERTPSENAKPPKAPVAPSDDEAPPVAPPQKGSDVPPQEGSAGVRPDSMRPDKQNDSQGEPDERERVQEYVKPEAKVYDPEGGVYWVKIPVEVYDPAHRLHPNRKVQVEVYEIDPKTGRETLVQRAYTGSSRLVTESGGDRRLVVGEGAIKPGSKYRVNAYFTYYNEYDEIIVENIEIENPYVETGVLPEGACVTFHDYYPEDNTKSSKIDFYYDDRLELTAVSLDKEATNEHALYGIKRGGGMKLHVKGTSANVAGVNLVVNVDGNAVAELKKGNITSIISPGSLRPDASYTYEITAVDFFDNEIKLVNASGDFKTCKGRPKASFKVTDNRIGATTLNLNIQDPNFAALFYGDDVNDKDNVSPEKQNSDVYIVVSSNPYSTKFPLDKNEISYYLNNGKRDKENDSPIYYAVKIPREDLQAQVIGYTGEGGSGLTLTDYSFVVPNLPSDEHFYVYAYADYDLGNGAGPVYFSSIGEYGFNSASIDTLGYLYVSTEIGADVTSTTANIFYSINTSRTNEDLIKYLTSADFKIVSAGGSDPVQYSHMYIAGQTMDIFKTGEKVHMTPEDYFSDKKEDLKALETATEYVIIPEVIATYNETEYPIKVIMSADSFKTMKKPVEVNIDNLLLAAGTMRFDVNIYDKDDAIIGAGADNAVLSVYTADGVLAKVMKIRKSHTDDEFTSIELTGLKTGTDYTLRFTASEYNEGYTTATYIGNKRLAEVIVAETVDLDGDLKLQNIYRDGNGAMFATVKAVFEDPGYEMAKMKYYVDVFRNGVLVDKKEYDPLAFDDYYTKGSDICVARNSDYPVVEDSTYDMRLYVVINNQTLVLDTITFTTDELVIPIHNEYEFIYNIKLHSGRGKFLICEDLNFRNDYRYSPDYVHGFDPNAEDAPKVSAYVTPNRITTIQDNDKLFPALEFKTDFFFDGKIDGQGFDLRYNVKKDGQAFFGSIGNHAEIYDINFGFSTDDATERIADEGFLCVDNYGHIHDIFITYEGGSIKNNTSYGLLCRYNTMSGIIENFVVHNTHTEDNNPFCAYTASGILGWYNYGTVRNGYVYGDDILADIVTPKSSYPNVRMGGIFGGQSAVGVMSNVYSLINVSVPDPTNRLANKVPYYYGNLLGESNGKVTNCYGIGESLYNQPSGAIFNPNGGPLFGVGGTATDTTCSVKTNNVFSWYETGNVYTNTSLATKYQKIATTTLCDAGWQKSILGAQFDTSMVDPGFYPQVILSKELPAQDYIPLPQRESSTIDLISANLEKYLYEEISIEPLSDGVERTALIEKAAIVKMRVYNPKMAIIEGVNLPMINSQIIDGTMHNEDGYTEFDLLVFAPKDYVDSYEIKSIRATLNGRTTDYPVSGSLRASFYLPVSTPDDWVTNVKNQPNKNARILCDIDFADVKEANIRVSDNHYGTLEGSKLVEVPGSERIMGYISEVQETSYEKGFALKNISLPTKQFVFYHLYGEIRNVTIDNFTAGTNIAPSSNVGFIYDTTGGGSVYNVHARKETFYANSYVGGIVCFARDSTIIENCSVKDLTLEYKERVNQNTTGYVGGVVGRIDNSRMYNCYASNIKINVNDIQCCEGAGGVIGYGYRSDIDTIYADGEISVRGSNVGGCIGAYYGTKELSGMKNMIAKVNLITHQDAIGGLVGYSQVDDMLADDTNMSGVAFGNVFAYNTDAEDVSFTIGAQMGANQKFFGSTNQLLNGMPNQERDEHTYALLNDDELKRPGTYTDRVTMTKSYNYSYVEDMNLPHVYYSGSTIELPDQDIIPMVTDCVSKNAVNIKQVKVYGEPSRSIYVTLINPNGYKVTGIKVEDELLLEDYYAYDSDNTGFIEVKYKGEQSQKHWKDSYLILGIYYEDENGNPGYSDYTEQPVRIPLTLFKNLYGLSDWSTYINADNAYGNYENYRLCKDIDFAGKSYTVNSKIGRLVGDVTEGVDGRATLSNININAASTSFIFRLNSEMSRINFEDCNLTTSGRSVVGLIGTSAGRIDLVDFTNVHIKETSNATYSQIGLIGCQVGSRIKRVRVTDCSVETTATTYENRYPYYVGGFVGFARSNVKFSDIEMNRIRVVGSEYVGGMLGYAQKACFDGITVRDVDVTGTWRYIGGVIGYNASGRVTKGNIPYMKNVFIYGSPITNPGSSEVIGYTSKVSFDAEHKYTGNNTEVGQFIGGIAGRTLGYKNGWDGTISAEVATPSLVADGVYVEGYGTYLGGAFGAIYELANTTVRNSIITINTRGGSYLTDQQRVGGVIGSSGNESYYLNAENVVIDVTNIRNIGAVAGYKTSTFKYCVAKNCEIKVHKTGNSYEINNVGGLVGYNDGAIAYDAVINVKINAPESDNVGGIVGYMNSTCQNSFYYATPDGAGKASAGSDYKIIGKNNVGGVAGWENKDRVLRACYTNANVVGEYYVGGIVGAYDNAYTRPSGYSYATTYLYYSYAAGTVLATRDYAGGIMGCNTMALPSNSVVTATHKAQGGRCSDVARAGGAKSGSSNETAYTNFNMVFVESVKSMGPHAGVFSGYTPDFEGLPNAYSGTTANLWNARGTFIWDGVKVYNNGDSVVTPGSTPVYWVAPATKNQTPGSYNVRYFKTSDLTDTNKAPVLYRNINWYRDNPDNTNSIITSKSYYMRLFAGNKVGKADEWADMGDADKYGTDTYYLPHVRLNEGSGKAISDFMTRLQSSESIMLPVPTAGASNAGLMTAMVEEPTCEVYISGADKVNVEFSEMLVGGGYYRIYYMDLETNETTLVDEGNITERVMTYETDMSGYIRVEYGEGTLAEASGEPYVCDYSTYANRNRVMVYKDKYYFLYYNSSTGENNLVYGDISNEIGSEEELYSNGRYTRVANVIVKDFVNIYNGYALAADGQIYDMNGVVTNTAPDGMVKCETATPLQRFTYNGIVTETYGGFTQFIGDNVTTQNSQAFAGIDGTVAIYYPSLSNVKNTALIYTKNSKKYNTVLGIDGKMVEIQQKSEEIGCPEDFRNSGILQMSDNFNSTIPVVLVAYSNGDLAGYNYKTGEWIINLSHLENPDMETMSLWDYASVYFDKPLTSMINAHNAYEDTSSVMRGINEGKTLEAIITGKGYEADGETEIAGDNKAEASLNQGIKDPNKEKTTDEENTSDELEELGSDSDIVNNLDNGTNRNESGNNTTEDYEAKVNTDTRTSDEKAVDYEVTGDPSGGGQAKVEGDSTANGKETADGKNETDQSGNALGNGDETGDLEGAEVLGGGAGMQTEANGTTPSNDNTVTTEEELTVTQENDTKESEADAEKKEEASEQTSEDSSNEAVIIKAETDKQNLSSSIEDEGVKYKVISYAGTPSTEALNDPVYSEEYADTNVTTEVKDVVMNGKYMTAYNPITGVYEIIDMTNFVRYHDYTSENDRLNIENIAAAAGYAEKSEEKKKAPGLLLYSILAVLILGGVGFAGYRFRKAKINK